MHYIFRLNNQPAIIGVIVDAVNRPATDSANNRFSQQPLIEPGESVSRPV